MEKEDTKKLLEILKASYPATYRNMSKIEMQEVASLYHSMFEEYPTEIVIHALKNYIRKNQYPPTIAGLQEQIDYIAGDNNSEAELWNAISVACKNGLHGAKEEFEKLPRECQLWLGGPSAIRDLSLIEPGVLSTVVRGEFLKSIKAIAAREESRRMLPVGVRRAIEDAKIKQIEGGEYDY